MRPAHWTGLLTVLLASCADPAGDLAVAAPDLLIGMPRAELLACAGLPKETIVLADEERMIFERERTIATNGRNGEPPFPSFADGSGPGRRYATLDRTLVCRAYVTVRNGRVVALNYAPGRDIGQCYNLLAACLPPLRGP